MDISFKTEPVVFKCSCGCDRFIPLGQIILNAWASHSGEEWRFVCYKCQKTYTKWGKEIEI